MWAVGLTSTRAAVALAMLAVSWGCAPEMLPPGYDDAAREVRDNLRTAQGRSYRRAVENELSRRLQRAARRCYVHAPETRGVRLLYRLDESGNPTESIVYPDTAFGRCVQTDIGQFELPPPPEPGYWVSFGVAPRSNVRSSTGS